MANNISKRPDGRWRARYRDAAGKEHSRHFARRADGQTWLDEVTAAVVGGSYIDPKAAKITLAEYAATWEAVQVCRPGTARITDNALRLHILPVLGKRPMSAILRTDVQALVKRLSATHSPGTVGNVYDTLTRVMAAAVDDRVVSASPCRRIALPKNESPEVIPPTVEEVAALIAAMPERYRAAVVLLAGSGLRIGELLGLDVPHVDFLRRTIRVEQQRLQNGQLGPCKTASSVRTVPVGSIVIEALADHLRGNSVTAGPLFTASKGQPVRYGAWKDAWKAALTATGLDLDTHSLRHFYASGLIAGGASVKQVQSALGHASAAITLKVYAHLWPGDDDRIRDLSDATMAPLRTARALRAV